MAVKLAGSIVDGPDKVYNGVETEYDERCDYFVYDTDSTLKRLPFLAGLYENLVGPLEDLTKKRVVKSPWLRSKINLNVFPNGKGKVGLHVDSNPITILVAFTDGAPLEFFRDGRRFAYWYPKPGKAAIFLGKEIAHRVVSREKDTTQRIVAPMNYYFEDDCSRPFWFDDYVYGNRDYEDLNG